MSDLPEAGHVQRRPSRAALAVAAGLFAAAVVIVVDMQRIPSAAAYGVGPTVVPYVVAAALALLAIGAVWSAFRGTFVVAERQELMPVAIIALGLVAQMLLLPFAGFILASAVLFVAVAFGFGERRVHLTAPFALVFAAVIWFVFARLLRLTLPHGPLENLAVTLMTPAPAG